MGYTAEQRHRIFDRTSGKCHICYEPLVFENYGRLRTAGAWEVDHSHARAKGGSDRLNNLYAACIHCNRARQAQSKTVARRKHGKVRAPMCVEKRRKAKAKQARAGGVAGGLVGAVLGGPAGALGGALLGVLFGDSRDPDDQ